MLRVLDLFSGIGAYALGVERAGMKVVAFCESEEFPRRVLRKHWPDVPIYEDVRTLTADTLRRDGIAVDVIVGGWPCQDISPAGTRAGLDGARSGLWSEIARLAGEVRPHVLILENSSALLGSPPEQPGRDFGRVLGDLAALGYDAEWHCLPAAAFDAPHIRDRLWIVASADADSEHGRTGAGWEDGPQADHSDHARDVAYAARPVRREQAARRPKRQRAGARGERVIVADTYSQSQIGTAIARAQRHSWEPEPDVGRVAPRDAFTVDRLRALGNCNPPIIPETIARAVIQSMGLKAADGERCNEGEKQT